MSKNFEHYQHPDRFGDWLGYKIVSFDQNTHQATVSLKIRDEHLSSARRVHGGVISAFFDFACGVAVFTTLGPKDVCSTIELKVNYLRPIELGDELIAKTQIVFKGNRLCVLNGFLYRNGEENPAAMCSSTFNVLRNKNIEPSKESPKKSR